MGDPFFLGWPLLAVETRVVGGPSVTYLVLIGLTLAVSRARTFPPPPRVVGHSIDWKVTEQPHFPQTTFDPICSQLAKMIQNPLVYI